MDGIHAVGGHDGQEHGRDQHDDGQRFHEHAEEDQQHHNEDPHDIDVIGQAEHHGGDIVGDAVRCHQVAERGGGEDQHQHAAGEPGGRLEGGHDAAELELSMDEEAHQQRVEDGHDGGFCGGEPAGVDAAEDDERGQDGPEAVLEGEQQVLGVPGHARRGDVLAAQVVHHAQGNGHDDAGDEAGHEHLGDAHLSGDAVDDHGDAGRDDDADAAGRGSGGGGVGRVIAALGHGRDHEHAHGGGGGRAGAGDGAEEHAGKHRGDGQTAGDGAHDVFGDVHESS